MGSLGLSERFVASFPFGCNQVIISSEQIRRFFDLQTIGLAVWMAIEASKTYDPAPEDWDPVSVPVLPSSLRAADGRFRISPTLHNAHVPRFQDEAHHLQSSLAGLQFGSHAMVDIRVRRTRAFQYRNVAVSRS